MSRVEDVYRVIQLRRLLDARDDEEDEESVLTCFVLNSYKEMSPKLRDVCVRRRETERGEDEADVAEFAAQSVATSFLIVSAHFM